MEKRISAYRQVQNVARETMRYIQQRIEPGMHLVDVREICEQKMLEWGADSFWYWGVGAFVFSGDETAVSMSGREYHTSDRIIQQDDIITIDLNPQKEKIWGDFARTIVLQAGKPVDPEAIQNQEWRQGLEMEDFLHRELRQFATPETMFEDIYQHMNRKIEERGFVNLDFLGNLGHSIVKEKEQRIYIERGNRTRLADAGFFTFEPHISVPGSRYGYKKENIYFFEQGYLQEL